LLFLEGVWPIFLTVRFGDKCAFSRAVEVFTAMRRALDEILEDNSMETLRLPLVEARNSCISDNCGSYRGVGSEIISACSGAHWDNSRPGVLLLEMQPRYAKSLLGQLPDDRRAIIEQVGSAFIGVQKAAIQNAVEPVREMDGF
jgi:hypothetical protein